MALYPEIQRKAQEESHPNAKNSVLEWEHCDLVVGRVPLSQIQGSKDQRKARGETHLDAKDSVFKGPHRDVIATGTAESHWGWQERAREVGH